jgi:hypothetical protein
LSWEELGKVKTESLKFLVNSNAKAPYPPRIIVPNSTTKGTEVILDQIGDIIFAESNDSKKIMKSDDGGKTFTDWVNVYTSNGFQVHPNHLVAINEKKVVAHLYNYGNTELNGWYIVEDLTGTFRIEKLSLEMVVDYPSSTFGITKYPTYGEAKIILLTEYGPQTEAAYGRHVHLSADGGETWRIIFELPEERPGNTHVHSATYDPYADRIWVCNGDLGASNIWYSDDWRNETPTWARVYPTGNAPFQATSIGVTPTAILFGSDGVGVNGIWYIKRDLIDPKFTKMVVKPLHILDKRTGTYYVGRYFKQNATGTAIYVLFTPNVTGLSSVLLGSADGSRWFEIYRSPSNDSASVFTRYWLFENEIIWTNTTDRVRIEVEWK